MDTPALPQWRVADLSLEAMRDHHDPYNTVTVEVRFVHSSGIELQRPAFWDGGCRWRVRFASPLAEGEWHWHAQTDSDDPGLQLSGQLRAVPSRGETRWDRHGLLAMSDSRTSLQHHDGSTFLLCADTAWALPWRASEEQVAIYAGKRREQGFNATLLMSLMPDTGHHGPQGRGLKNGFARAFADLSQGHLRDLQPGYFQDLDRLVRILVAHDIAPVWSPLFHGYGFMGKAVIGKTVADDEAARYARYLQARYGAWPALWLAGADGWGDEPSIPITGRAIRAADAYAQPVGIHYNPMSDNRSHQAADWLDFQWCQTGHAGEHRPDRVADAWRNQPPKGVANGEPTYERMGSPERAADWWQGHEAWCNLCAGGTMGVVYGAGSLWNWLQASDEDQPDWCRAPGADWRAALDFPGAEHVGRLAQLLADIDTTGLEPRPDATIARRACGVGDRLLIVYLEAGGGCTFSDRCRLRAYRLLDPRSGAELERGQLTGRHLHAPDGEPAVLILGGMP